MKLPSFYERKSGQITVPNLQDGNISVISINKLSARQFEALDNRSFVLNVLCVMEYNVGKASVSVLWFWAESYVSWAVTNSKILRAKRQSEGEPLGISRSSSNAWRSQGVGTIPPLIV
jgi:hypothetical protein